MAKKLFTVGSGGRKRLNPRTVRRAVARAKVGGARVFPVGRAGGGRGGGGGLGGGSH